MKTFNAITYLRRQRIPHTTEGQNVGPGWVGIRCPFCGDTSDHGGFNLTGGYYSCWRCGGHPLEDVIMRLERIPYHEACQRVQEHQGRVGAVTPSPTSKKGVVSLTLPLGTNPMQERHKDYLRHRQFDPDQLERDFNLMGTGPAGQHCWRIVAPIYFQGQLVSYQCRDITGKAELRYKSCATEVIKHKHLLYNLDACNQESVIVVEGITDVWRLGTDCCCTFGIKYTHHQVNLLAEFKRVVVLYDAEPQAQKQGERLCQLLSSRGVETETIKLDSGDPAALSQVEADKLKREVLA